MSYYPCLMFRSPGPHKMPGKDGPTYGYVGVNDEDEELAALEKGYVRSRNAAIGRGDPLDHDGDGKKGGSLAHGGDEVKALREQYEARFGKKPFGGWGADKLREKLEGEK